MRIDTRAAGIAAAVASVLIWTAFIVVARAMALKSLTPWDIVALRIAGAALVLVPWGVWLVRRRRAQGRDDASWLGMSPLGARVTGPCGLFGGIG
jgi:hypothetical protein